jgi:hypothetical protein
MNAEELNRLLEKYYSGESTQEEEMTLREYFNGDNILNGFEAEKKIFAFYMSTREVPEPSLGFEKRILAGIDMEERNAATSKMRKLLIPVMSAAASILILAGTWFYFDRRIEAQDTYTDPRIARAETMKILRDVSSKMNRATDGLQPVSKINVMKSKSFKAINKSAKIIEKNLKSLEKLPFDKLNDQEKSNSKF